jgi:hypothetical protein
MGADCLSISLAGGRISPADHSSIHRSELREGSREAEKRHPDAEFVSSRDHVMHRSGIRLLIGSILIAVALVLMPTVPSLAAQVGASELLVGVRQCDAALQAAAKATGVPLRLLRALAPVESGLRSRAGVASLAWPWTINANQYGRYYFRTRAAAERHLRALLEAGIDNVDIGCMQVNWRWHRQVLSSPAIALTPPINAQYAALMLKAYHDRTGSWAKAVGLYHSRSPVLADAYSLRVARALKGKGRAVWGMRSTHSGRQLL